MILPTESDFQYVTNLSHIDLGVDVLPNRTGPNRNLLYGKDAAVLAEHSGVNHFLFDGLNIRNAYTITARPDDSAYSYPRTFPYVFDEIPNAENLIARIPFWHTQEYFDHIVGGEKKTGFVSIYFRKMMPKEIVINPVETLGLVEFWEYEAYDKVQTSFYDIMKEEQILPSLNDMKLQSIAGLSLGNVEWYKYPGYIEDQLVKFDVHGDGPSITNPDPFQYNAYYHKSTGSVGDGWYALSSPTSQPYTITVPNNPRIDYAELIAWFSEFRVNYIVNREGSTTPEDRSFTVPTSALRLSSVNPGSVIQINQNMIMLGGIKRIIQGLGHPFKTASDIAESGAYYCNYTVRSNVSLMLMIKKDDHTKWWT